MTVVTDTRRAWAEPTEQTRHELRRGGFIGSIVVNALLLYLAHHLVDWQVPWITADWSKVLWAVDLSLEAALVANALYMVFDARWFRNLAGAICCALAVLATSWLYLIFPFDFGSATANDLARLILTLTVVGTVIATLVMIVLAVIELLRPGVRALSGTEE